MEGGGARMTFRQFCCWLTGHGWQLSWDTQTNLLGWPIQRLVSMRCQFCGYEAKMPEGEASDGT